MALACMGPAPPLTLECPQARTASEGRRTAQSRSHITHSSSPRSARRRFSFSMFHLPAFFSGCIPSPSQWVPGRPEEITMLRSMLVLLMHLFWYSLDGFEMANARLFYLLVSHANIYVLIKKSGTIYTTHPKIWPIQLCYQCFTFLRMRRKHKDGKNLKSWYKRSVASNGLTTSIRRGLQTNSNFHTIPMWGIKCTQED
jgi:hypothetical protein